MNKILVTGIGGNVGYGILRNIRSTYKDIEIIGTNTTAVSAGNHLCDHTYKVPFSTDTSYIKVMHDIVVRHGVNLIIPSTDYEAFTLALHTSTLPVVAVSPAETTKLFLDKYLSYTSLTSMGIRFAESILPSDYDGRFSEYIIKPREGRGSRNLFINPPDPKSFSDEYIIQPLLSGKEITTAFYITKNNELHGSITLERELSAGATSICEVITGYDEALNAYITSLINKIEIRGSCNLQSIITNDNNFIPFEVNCRISGTNSIRSQFGFTDVAYTVDEYLFNKQPAQPRVITGSAIRITDDIIYPGISLKDISNNKDNFYIYGT